MRAFSDSNADGIGDFQGSRRSWIIFTIWASRASGFCRSYPSPLKVDGYDIASYAEIHPDYGTLRDFRIFLHLRRIGAACAYYRWCSIHTSDQHPVVRNAARGAASGGKERNYYVWSDNQEQYKAAHHLQRLRDFQLGMGRWPAYYWHLFIPISRI